MMHFNKIFYISLYTLIGGMLVSPLQAYETHTHAVITDAAYDHSDLGNANAMTTLQRLGLDRLDTVRPFQPYWNDQAPDYYYDNADVGSLPYSYVRRPNAFERSQMSLLQREKKLTEKTVSDFSTGAPDIILPIRNWLIRGVIREDDMPPSWPFYDRRGPRPDGDPWGDFARVYDHFFDPIHRAPLSYLGNSCSFFLFTSAIGCPHALNWALGVHDAFASPQVLDPTRQNHFSWADARENFYLALTAKRPTPSGGNYVEQQKTNSAERLYRWTTTFNALGHTIHLLQDMAQPQHTRNDAHNPFLTSGARQSFEPYTNARLIGVPALKDTEGKLTDGGAYVRGFFNTIPDDKLQFPPLQIGNYPSVQLASVMQYFTTQVQDANVLQRRGLADYSNRGFFTSGTMDNAAATNAPFTLPRTDFSNAASGYMAADVPCEDAIAMRFQGRKITCRKYLNSVPDSVNPAYPDAVPTMYANYGGKIPLASGTMWSVVYQYNTPVSFYEGVTDIHDFEPQADFLIPRAVGYSAGLINYFFRGQLTLSSPPDGLYGVVDQGTPHTVQDGVPLANGTIFGFKQVRLRVKNNTGDANGNLIESGSGTAVPQTMQGGKLVAIARYHRNPCYQTDLSGEYVKKTDGTRIVPSGCGLAQTRTPYAEISVSAPVTIDANGNLPGAGASANPCANVGNINSGATGNCQNNSALIEFDFSQDAVPINATDLFLQVVYRGPLGNESDGIAVGSLDLLEPNFFTEWNNTDWFLYNSQWTVPENVPNPPGANYAITARAPSTELSLCFASQLVARLPTGQQLDPQQFVRIAVLTDRPSVRMGSIAVTNGQTASATDGWMPTIKRQSNQENGGVFISDPPAFFGRGITLGFDGNLSYSSYGNYTWNLTALLNLTPTLGTNQAPGIPHPMTVQYTGTVDNQCASVFSAISPTEPSLSEAGNNGLPGPKNQQSGLDPTL